MSTIQDLSSVNALSDSDQFPIFNESNASNRKVSATVIRDYMQANFPSGIFNTRAELTTAAAKIAANGYALVLNDETQGGVQTLYRKTNGVLVVSDKLGGTQVEYPKPEGGTTTVGGRLDELYGPTGASKVGFTPTPGITATDLQEAVAQAGSGANLDSLPSASIPVAAGDLLMVSQSGVKKKITASVFRTEFATEAVAAASAAQTSAINAANSATASLASNNSYDTEPIGRAASIDGQLFLVRTVGNTQLFTIFRRDNAGASTNLGTISFASAAAVAAITPVSFVFYKHIPGDLLLTTSMSGGTRVLSFISPTVNYDGLLDAVLDPQMHIAIPTEGSGYPDNLDVIKDTAGVLRVLDAFGGKTNDILPLAQEFARTEPIPLATASFPVRTGWNGMLGYGQSLIVGATGQPAISLTQPFSNLTFIAGPKASKAGSVGGNPGTNAVKPLVEDNLFADDINNRGETLCSGGASAACSLAAIDAGVAPSSFVIFASTAGHGGYRLDQLTVGAEWYQVFQDHVTEAKLRATEAGQSYSIHAVVFSQSETDNDQNTNVATWKSRLVTFQAQAQAFIQSVTGQTHPVPFLMIQTSYKVATNSGFALAILDLCLNTPNFYFVTPAYAFKYNTDLVHLVNTGYLRESFYVGRAYKQLVIDRVVPDFIRPLGATYSTSRKEVRMKFRVPQRPLLLDRFNMLATTNDGFVVRDDVTPANTISSIRVSSSGDTVVLSGVPALGANPRLRYALDNKPAGLDLQNGAAGNLRDSTADMAMIGSTFRTPAFHLCPHFEVPITVIP